MNDDRLEIAIHSAGELPAEGPLAHEEPALGSVRVLIVRPGDRVRLANVLDAVVPAVKTEDPAATFPGVLGPADAPVGLGATAIVEDLAVLPVFDWRGAGYPEAAELPDAFVDMEGPGARMSPWSRTTNVVLIVEPAPGLPAAEADAAIRRLALRTARDLAAAAAGSPATAVESFGPVPAGAGPRVGVVLQVGSEGPLLDTYLFGRPALGQSPTVVDPRAILDGALVSGAYDWAGMRNPTAVYQRSALIRSLYGRRELTFAGVIVSLGYLDTAEAKRAAAAATAGLAEELGLDAAVCTTFGSGNSHTDTMLTVRVLERAGVRTVALVAETNGGLTDHVPEADALISVGNEDELAPPWVPDVVIGADPPGLARPVPAGLYLGALTQTGHHALTAVPA